MPPHDLPHTSRGALDELPATRQRTRFPWPPAEAVARLLPPLDGVGDGRVIVRDGQRTVVGVHPDARITANGENALDRLHRLGSRDADRGWWAGFLAYDIGRSVERIRPRTQGSGAENADVPDVSLGRFDARLVIDPRGVDPDARDDRRSPSDTTSPSVTVEGDGAGREALDGIAQRLIDGDIPPPHRAPLLSGKPTTSMDRPAFENAVRRVIGLLEAGDCYQVNLTRQLTWPVAPDTARLFSALSRGNPAPHAALIDLAGTGVVSASPERFLAWEGRSVETRPIKGTDRDASALAASTKDNAENVMIVDLARNDLGRVCVPGSIDVTQLCALEAHPGLFHLVSTVRGRRRDDSGLGDLLAATLPPASVTGAPKPRVLQAIEDLEPVRRGVYCGAIGWIDTVHERGDLAVAIRTFTVHDDSTRLGVGAGIVADSDPAREWEETELKASRVRRSVGEVLPALVGAGAA